MPSVWRTLDRDTARAIALVCVADALVGASFGAIAVSGGLGWWVPVVMSLVVFAGGAQFAAIGVVLAGGSPVAAVVAGIVLNARLLPYGFAIAGIVGRRGWWTRILGAHVTTDESVAFAIQQPDERRGRAAFWACGVALFVVWNVAVAAGATVGRLVEDTATLGLDAAFPVVLLALLLPALRERRTGLAAGAGAVVALAMSPFLPPGLPVLFALVGLITVAGGVKEPTR